MNYKEYEERLKKLKADGARGKALDFNGQKPIEFLKMEIFEIQITDAAFHWAEKWVPPKDEGRWTKETEIVDWKKNYILMLGGLCGIESEPSKSEKTGKYSYLSQANVYRMTPSGHKIYESAEYEFDSEVRAEEIVLKNEIKFMEQEEKLSRGEIIKPKKMVKQKYSSDAKKRLAVVEMAKNARSRADTGAHKRAIIKMLKLPSPDVNLIGSYLFCFQCVPDFTNSVVRNQYLLGHNDGGGVFGETTRPALKDATIENEPSIEFKIGEQRVKLKEYKALYKLTGLILMRKENLEEYYSFITNYTNLTKEDKVDEIVKRLTDFIDIPGVVISGDPTIKYSFVTEWGNN